MTYIHSTSILEKTVRVGDKTQIWHFCHIDDNAVIGKNCILGQNVYVGKGVKIGDNVRIQNNVSVYSGVEIEEGAFIGPSVVFTNVKRPRAFYKQEFAKTLVKKFATLGANSTIMCGVTIGEHAFVGAGAVVTKDIEDKITVVGNPARKL